MTIRAVRVARAAGLCSGLALAGAAAAGPAPTYTILYRELDDVAGVGGMTGINNQAINSAGSWVAELDTNNGDTNVDVVFVRDGQLVLQENAALTPPGAALSSFDSTNINSAGQSAWNLFLRNQPTGQDSGVYFGTSLVLLEGTVSQAAAFSDGTPYIGFFEVKLNDGGDLLVMSSVDDPLIASTVDRALVVFDLDPAGALLSETVLVKEGDQLTGQTEFVAELGTGPNSFAFNNAGDAMYVVDLTGDAAFDGAVYINGNRIAQEGSASSVDGRNWLTLGTSTKVHLNNTGGYVHTGSLDGDAATNAVIMKNGQVFAQEGGTLPAIAPHTLTAFGTGPVYISDTDDVLWFGDWNDPDTSRDTGLFINETLLLQENVTVIDGMTVTTVRGIEDGYSLSPNGRFVLARVVLDGSADALVKIDLGGGGCATDWNDDGGVNSSDISAFLTGWLDSLNNGNLVADFNGDNAVNSSDISAFLTQWLADVTGGSC